jgi:ABC-2 type transport system permease protein
MWTRILQHEWKNLLADRTLWVVAGLFAAVTFYGVYNGARWVRFQRATIEQALEEESERLRGHREFVASGAEPPTPWRDPRSPYAVGGSMGRRYAYLPPAPLAPLAIGQSDLYPYYFQVSTGSKQSFLNNYELENPENLLAGRFDLAFAIIYLFPLFILSLSYNLLSAEREQGTLAMVLSQPVSLRTLALGKITLRALLVLGLGLGLATAAFLASGSARGASFRSILLWMGVVAIYCLFWFALAVAVNAFGKSSAANAMILAGIWLVLVVIVPASVNLLVTARYPVPSRVELVQAIREATNDANARAASVMARYFNDHPEMVPRGEAPDPNDYQTRSYAIREDVERAMAPVLASYDQQLLRQQAQVDRLKYLSPAIVAQEGLNDIAGTGLARYKHFLSLVDEFHVEWREFFVSRVFARETLGPADYDRIPKFRFVEESPAAVQSRVSKGLAGLLAPGILVFALGMGGLRRYPITG